MFVKSSSSYYTSAGSTVISTSGGNSVINSGSSNPTSLPVGSPLLYYDGPSANSGNHHWMTQGVFYALPLRNLPLKA